MKACASVSGGVMFIPDEVEYVSKPTKYSEFVDQEQVREKVGVFGKKKTSKQSDSKVA